MKHPLQLHDRQGFTLLEVLLALSLLTVLLLGLTSAIAVHLRAFDTGRGDVTQAQLARALFERMASDLTSLAPAPAAAPRETLPAAPRPVAEGAPGGEPSLDPPPSPAEPAWVISGERQHLRLVARRGRHTWPADVAAAELDSPSSQSGLVLIHYRWQADTETGTPEPHSASGEAPLPGLTRVAAPWIPEVDDASGKRASGVGEEVEGVAQRSPLADGRADRPFGSMNGAASSPERFTEPLAGTTTGAGRSLGLAPPDLGELHIAEVADVAFRYFDGRTWHASWPAPGSGPLPRAVEIRLALADPSEAQSWREAGGVFDADESSPTASAHDGVDGALAETNSPNTVASSNPSGSWPPWAGRAGARGTGVMPPAGHASPDPSSSLPQRRAARSTIQVYRRVVILPLGTLAAERRPPVEPPATSSDFTP